MTVGDQPVIVLRDQAGDLQALANLCAHRGTLLVDEPGNTKRFQCPYHAWTFADDGRLLGAPHTDRSEIDREALGLPRYRAESWHGLVFVSLDPAVPSLAERLAHLDEIVDPLGLDDLHHWTSRRRVETWDCNWKLAITNAMESYHLFKVHPETLEPYTPTTGSYYIHGAADGTATGGASTRGDDYVLLSLPPNLVGVATGGTLLWQAVFPLAHDRCRVVAGGAYPSADPDHSGAVGRLVKRAYGAAMETMIPDFLPEDKAICERGQKAASGTFEPGPLVAMEQVVIDFHDFLARQLHGVTPPPGGPIKERSDA
ncbi:MAG: SRPBCC family protein [Actinomycetota bacterium]